MPTGSIDTVQCPLCGGMALSDFIGLKARHRMIKCVSCHYFAITKITAEEADAMLEARSKPASDGG